MFALHILELIYAFCIIIPDIPCHVIVYGLNVKNECVGISLYNTSYSNKTIINKNICK